MDIVAWPSHSCTILGDAPYLSIKEAWVCRASRNRVLFKPARFAILLITLRIDTHKGRELNSKHET